MTLTFCALLCFTTLSKTLTPASRKLKSYSEKLSEIMSTRFLEKDLKLNSLFYSGDRRQDPREDGTKAATGRGKHLLFSLMLSIIEN